MNVFQMKTTIERGVRLDGKKFWFSARSRVSGYNKWSNTLYLHFHKEAFPQIKSPPLVEAFILGGERFDYDQSVLGELDFHRGVTFYQEHFNPENRSTIVKVGCDYQHYGDEQYEACDSGVRILNDSVALLSGQFEALVEKLSTKVEL